LTKCLAQTTQKTSSDFKVKLELLPWWFLMLDENIDVSWYLYVMPVVVLVNVPSWICCEHVCDMGSVIC
jgi:hypothetical protein